VILADGTIVKTLLVDVEFDEFSAVDVPAHKGARAVVTKRAPILTATPKEPSTMTTELETVNKALTDTKAQLATVTADRDALTKSVGYWQGVATLSADERDYFNGLAEHARPAWVAKSAVLRMADVKAAAEADTVEVTFPDGRVVKKSAGPEAVGMAKMNLMLINKFAALEAESDRAKLEKRASVELANIGGKPDGKIAILKALDGKAITAEEKTAAAEVLKAANDGLKAIFKTRGTTENGDEEPVTSDDAHEQIEKIAKRYATEKKIPLGMAYNIVTDAGHADCDEKAVKLYRAQNDAVLNAR